MNPLIEIDAYECPICRTLYAEKHIMLDCFKRELVAIDAYFCSRCGTGYKFRVNAEKCCSEEEK